MISMLSKFLNNSIAYLSIYDIFIINLFILVLILSIVSGIIIVSARVKKFNLELNKSKDIQDIQSKIITNRLDLILNKLDTNTVLLNNLTNKDIKNAVIEDSTDDTTPEIFIGNNNIPEVPSILSNEVDGNSSNITLNHQILDSSNSNLSMQKSEHLNIDQEKLPKSLLNKNNDDIYEQTENNAIKTIDINENLNKKNNIRIDINKISTRDNIEDNISESSFEKGESIPLEVVNNKKYDNRKQIHNKEKYDSKKCYSTQETDNIVLANKILNELKIFSNKEKYNITNIISEDGQYIENITNNKLNTLNKKEVIKQLLIQALISNYNYPLETIEVNYDINLAHNIYKTADIIVFDKNDDSYILFVIDIKSEDICLNSLIQIAKCTITPFIVWTDGNTIIYYKNLNGTLKEISDIPKYYQDICSSNTSYNSKYISRPSYNQLHSNRYTSYQNRYNNSNSYLNKSILNNNPLYFTSDIYNIFKKEPYSLSNEYKSIIEYYKNFSSAYNNNYIPEFHQQSNFNNFYTNQPIMNNNINSHNNNLSPYHDFNNIPNQRYSFMPQNNLSNNLNLNTGYNNQFYENKYNLYSEFPDTITNNNIRFNNHNMFPKYL